ncbi:MAG: penicillin-binding transpeptidase domain-containing protein [Lachnospiraceae bacterium]|nr:penicillin-binding transpeptidase domain-containing protein [Lachnospiraceae bacterium]
MFVTRKNIRSLYLALVGMLIIVISTSVFFHRMFTLELEENRRFVLQAVKNTVMGTIYDCHGTVLGTGTAIGSESWNTDYSVCMGNLLGTSPGLSKINAFHLRSFHAGLLYGQKQSHLGFRDLTNTSSVRIGGSLQLTVDADLQKYAYELISSEFSEAAAVVLDYSTGEIKAAVSVPSFDLNDESVLHLAEEATTDKDGKEHVAAYLDDERAVSKALHELYMPGSEIKGPLYAAALTYDPSLYDTFYECNGSHVNQYGITVKCAGGISHGKLDNMGSALALSCNGYAETVFEALTSTDEGRQVLINTMRAFGFDASYSYPGFAYSDGIFLGKEPGPDAAETYSAIGGGECRTSVFGLAVVYAAIANRGTLVLPHMVRASSVYSDEPLAPYEDAGTREVCSSDVSELVLEMMEEATENGTGKKMAINGIRVCSKTGTAVHDDKSKETLWATAILDAPESPYVAVVMLDNTDSDKYTASGDAGRMVRDILEYVLSATENKAQ